MDPSISATPMRQTPSMNKYHHLAFLADRSDYLFRVWSESSRNPLVTSDDPSLGGFTAKHAAFHGMDERQYRETFQKLYRDKGRWLHQPLMRATVVRHTTGDEGNIIRIQSIENQLATLQIQDDSSPWISTSGSIKWATFEVCRRLAMHPDTPIHLTVLRRPIHGVELRTRATSVLDSHMEDLITSREWAAVESVLALKIKARESREVLWYGRIFPKSIVSDMTWTSQSPAFNLPASFLPSTQAAGAPVLPWLNQLSWNPEQDDWRLAQRKNESRRIEVVGQGIGDTQRLPPHWSSVALTSAKRQRMSE